MSRDPLIVDQIRDQLAELRRQGMNDGDIAAAIGMSRKTAWAYRNGEIRNPMWSTTKAIERLYEKRGLAGRERP